MHTLSGASFANRLIIWQREHGRHDLPWQQADVYRVWLSEIMLQQTQVNTVLPYYRRFLSSFPDVRALADATEEQVLAHWSGLGYYARGRNLHRSARIIMEKYHGKFPEAFEQIIELPGIGRSTAAAICALAFHERRAILDGNVKRLLARHHGIDGWTGDKSVEAKLWDLANALLPDHDVAIYIQAQMDMGATLCSRSNPKCELCPVSRDCVALQTDRIREFPAPRPRKIVPERHAIFVLLVHGREVLLEKRPPQGIWGGMWCLPQLDDGQDIVADYILRNGIELNVRAELDIFTHTLTHFRLYITPVLLRVMRKPLRLQKAGLIWLDVEDALQSAIPTPVRKMLENYRANPNIL